jgi:hypothetical protein
VNNMSSSNQKKEIINDNSTYSPGSHPSNFNSTMDHVIVNNMSSSNQKKVKISIQGEAKDPIYDDNTYSVEIAYGNNTNNTGSKTIKAVTKDGGGTDTFKGNISLLKIQFDSTSNYIFTGSNPNGDVDPTPSLQGNFTQVLIEEDQSNLNKTIEINNTGDVNGWTKIYDGNGKVVQIVIE